MLRPYRLFMGDVLLIETLYISCHTRNLQPGLGNILDSDIRTELPIILLYYHIEISSAKHVECQDRYIYMDIMTIRG